VKEFSSSFVIGTTFSLQKILANNLNVDKDAAFMQTQ
jgi:hypothetical protein